MADPGKAGLSTHERFILDFFRKIGPIDFAGHPYNHFLNVIVRQISESQPSVKHGAFALTAICHTRAKLYFGGSGCERQKNFVLRQTSKSITHLLQRPTTDPLSDISSHREVVMTMCGVLAILSQQQGDLAAWKMHLEHGLRTMREWQEQADFDGSSIAPILSVILTDQACRLRIMSNPSSFLQDDSPFLLQSSALANFSVSTAEYVVNRHFAWWSTDVIDEDNIPDGFASANRRSGASILISHRLSFLFKVRIYTRRLKDCIDQVGISAPQSVQDLLTALRLWEQTACAMVTAALTNGESVTSKPSQTGYDAALVYFRRTNEFGKKILQSLIRQNTAIPFFPIDYAVGTPLFFCAFRCRDWSTRREALRLLKALEEIFRGQLDAAALTFLPMKISALERIIAIESHGLQPGDVVPESARIYYVEFTGRPGSSDIIHFSYRPVGMDAGLVEIL